MLRFLCRCLLFVVFFAVVAELFFRTLVPASQPPFQAYDPQFGILRLEGSPNPGGVFTVGRLARERTRWKLNGAGWNSPREYLPRSERNLPCVAVIGNSYVEGFYADVDSGLTAALEGELGASGVVYGFGKSGVNAPQMLRVADYAAHHFAPECFVFILNHGSLRSALRNFGFVVSNEQYLWEDGQLRPIPPTPYSPNRLMRLHTHSAFVRYLYHNAGILKTRAAIRQEAVQRNDPLAVAQQADELPLQAAVAREIARRARAEHPQARILFVVDGDRRAMYESASRPEPLRESPVWEAACRETGCEFLDLTDCFWAAYQADGRRLDLATNYHWNQHGMAVAARAIAGVLGSAPLSSAVVPSGV
jgi:nucleoside phosphorylase